MKSPAPWCFSPLMKPAPSPARRCRSMAGSIWCELLVIARSACDEAIQLVITDGLDCFASLAMTAINVPPHRNPDRTDRNPDVVAACRADGCNGENSGVPIGRDDVCDRRIGGFSGRHRPRFGGCGAAPAGA